MPLLSTLGLVEDLGEHLNTDAGIVDLVGDAVFHKDVAANQKTPFVLYACPRISLRDAQGMGEAQSVGQVADITCILSIIDEKPDPSGLGELAEAADSALRSWSPSGWSVLQLEAVEERADSHVSEGETLQSASLQYRVIAERV